MPDPLAGLALLTEDREFIRNRLRRVPVARHREALEQYAARWQEAADLEPVEHRRANAGRRAANGWMLGAT
jgi:hypothetical protein